MRDWLENHRWYWYTLTISITPFFWHWQKEYTNYGWGYQVLFGPIGIMIIKPSGTREDWKKENGTVSPS